MRAKSVFPPDLLLIVTGCVFTVMIGICSIDAAPINAGYEYQEIKQLYKKSLKGYESTELEVLIETSRTFIDKHPKYKKTDHVYYILGNGLIRADRTDEGIQIFQRLAKDYSMASYVAPALLELGLAYDKLNQHDKANVAYQKLIKHPKYGSRSFAKRAQELFALDKAQRTGSMSPSSSQGNQPSALVGQKAIDFHVTDLNGAELSLEKYRNKVVLLDFWAIWCGPCLAEMPNVKRVYEKYKDRNFQIIGINLDQNRSKLQDYLKKEGIRWPQFFDGKGWQNEVAQMYQVNSIPSMYLIDGSGVVRKANLRGPALESAIGELIRENNAKTPSSKSDPN